MEQALEKQDFSGVDAIGVDEYSHKGQHYITVFLAHPERDGAKTRVLFTVEGKRKDTMERFQLAFKAKRADPDKVGDVTSDMCHG